MGFKDVSWALSLNGMDLPPGLSLTETAILVGFAHHTDDATHSTIVGMQTLAGELGANVKTVRRAVSVLTAKGLITREERKVNGWRTTDTVTLHTTWTGSPTGGTESPARDSESPGGTESPGTLSPVADFESPEGTESHRTLSPLRVDSESPGEGLKVQAEEINQIDQPEDQPVKSQTNGARFAQPLCDVLTSELKALNVKVLEPTPKAWLDAARLMVDRDKRDPREARDLIVWACQDSFWQSNIHSMPTFREKYDRLRMQRERGSSHRHGRQTPEDRMRATLALVTDLKEIS